MILLEARKLNRLSQQDLADMAGITQTQISMIEQGKAFPRKQTRQAIERVLGYEINWITTKLQGSQHKWSGKENREKPKDRITREIDLFLNSCDEEERLSRHKLLQKYIDQQTAKANLMDKVRRLEKGEKVVFAEGEFPSLNEISKEIERREQLKAIENENTVNG